MVLGRQCQSHDLPSKRERGGDHVMTITTASSLRIADQGRAGLFMEVLALPRGLTSGPPMRSSRIVGCSG